MYKIKESFKWAHHHVDVKEYESGQEFAFDDADLIEVATQQGWIELADKPKAKAHKAAPENKAD